MMFTNITDLHERGINITYNLTLPDDFCEGKKIPYFAPGVYEIFSSITGGFLILVGFIGLLQPRLEMLMKLMYAGLSVSGIGTVLLHYKRIVLYNYADLYPLFFTVALGIIALFDELVFEFRRPRDTEDRLLDWSKHHKNERTNFCRILLDAIAYCIVMIYLVIGFTLCVFSSEFTFDIVGFYFAIPFVFTAFGGMIYLTIFKQYKNQSHAKKLRELRNTTLITGILSIIFKVTDSFFCTDITVWLFPHPLFHLLTTYATHCFIVFVAFYRANNILGEQEQERSAEIYWFLKFYPHIFMPDFNDREAAVTFAGSVAATPYSPKSSLNVQPETPINSTNKSIGGTLSFSLNQ